MRCFGHPSSLPLARAIVIISLMLWLVGSVHGQTTLGETMAVATQSGYLKSNQSKVFHHAGYWWAIARSAPDSRWFLWQFKDGTWSRHMPLGKPAGLKYSALVEAGTGRLFLVGSHASTPEFWRCSFDSAAATWSPDAGFPINPSFVNADGVNPLSLVQARNGDLWLFRITNNRLQTKRSRDGGATWSAVINLKTGLAASTGTTAAVAFSAAGNDYVGVAYGETSTAGSSYGFLKHRDGDTNFSWGDESAGLAFFSGECADARVAAGVDPAGNVYVFTQNGNVGPAAPFNTLYKRSPAGSWDKFIANSQVTGVNWKSPGVVIDSTNQLIILMGTNLVTQQAEYKLCSFGSESFLASTPARPLLTAPGAIFDEISVPATMVGTANQLMICGDNTTKNDIWYRQLNLQRVILNSVVVDPPTTNATASCTIAMTLAEGGALPAGAGYLTFRFPAGTLVCNNLTAADVTVAGAAAGTVVVDSARREVQVTTPVELPGGYSFEVVFHAGPGLVNPAFAGSYTISAFTSAQPVPGTSPAYVIDPGTGGPLSADTQAGYQKSNQSKVFYHDSQWWALAFNQPDNTWYIWKYDGTNWSKIQALRKGLAYRWDAVLNPVTGKLHLFGSHRSAPYVYRFSYSGGAWTKDAGFPVLVADFTNPDENNPVNMVQAKNGELWIFRINNHNLQGRRSNNGGQTWSAALNLKTGLHMTEGTTDAVTFSQAGKDYLGLAYAEAYTINSQFGFLLREEGTPNGNWTDESASLTWFADEKAHNSLSLTSDANGNLYLLTRNEAGDPRNTLYKRSSGGTWSKHKVNSGAASWKSPALAIDAASNRLYAMGVNLLSNMAEYKICSLGQEASLEKAVPAELFEAPGMNFADLSVPGAPVHGVSGLMVCADNTTTNDIWFRLLGISANAPVQVGPIAVVSQEVNANATYTIPVTLTDEGALPAGLGTLNFRFPENTSVPNSMPAGAVQVDGVPATTIISNQLNREVSVTTPVSLPANHSFNVVFDSSAGAGLLNPTIPGSLYSMAVWTSAQPAQITSPPYSLIPATTTVTPASVIPFPAAPDSAADYTVSFNLGAHGRLLSGQSTLILRWPIASRVKQGAITGAKLNNVPASALGDSAQRQIQVTVPAALSLSNLANATLFLPNSALRNPALPGAYTLTVATSVETTAVASQPFNILPNASFGGPIPGTTKNFDRANQSKMFYFNGFWWVAAQYQVDYKWYLWKFNGSTWTRTVQLHGSTKTRPDCVLDGTSKKVYLILPGSSQTQFTRLSHANGEWTVDGGFPTNIPDFKQEGDRGISLVRAKNGHLWAFLLADSALKAVYSSTLGETWSPVLILKQGLNDPVGLTDAVAYTANSTNFIGVGYAEDSAPNSGYGFLRHKDSDTCTVWIDETTKLPAFAGTTADDHLSMAVYNNRVLMVVKTKGGGPASINVGLLVREPGGAWAQFPISLSSGWTRPTLAIDGSNAMLHVFGTREGSPQEVEMKKCALGDYGSLLSAPIDTIFKNHGDNFMDMSVAAHWVNNTMQLLVCSGNETRNDLWYNLLPLGSASPKLVADSEAESEPAPAAPDEMSDGVAVFPNPFNPHTAFHVRVRENAEVKLQIFNLAGQVVRTLVDGALAPGVHVRRWNGRSQEGRHVASGVYLYRLQIGTRVWTGRVQLLK